MKTAHDPRHQKRRLVVQQLFALEFTTEQDMDEGTKEIMSQVGELDEFISKAAPQWPIDKLNRIDLAILRLAVFEIKQGQVPPKVAIDEAVELAKEFGSESSPGFINGVLGTVLKNINPDFVDNENTDEK
jgi:N utilization substance protein B